MAYPYPAPAANKADGTATAGDHAPHHDALANALNDLLAELGSGPKGAAADLTTRLAALSADTGISVNPSGLVVIQGADTNVHAALARLDAAFAGKVSVGSAPTGTTIGGTFPALEVAAGSCDQSIFKPSTLIPASEVAIPTDGAVGTPTMRTLGIGTGKAASGVDPLGLGLAMTIPYFSSIAAPAFSTVTANTICYVTRFIGGSPVTKIRFFFNNTSSGGNMRVGVYSSKNAGPAATPDQMKLDTGVIACPAPGLGIPVDLSLIAGGSIVTGDWLFVAADNGTMSLWTTFLNSTASIFAGQSGYFTIASIAAVPASAPAINTFGFQHWALAIP